MLKRGVFTIAELIDIAGSRIRSTAHLPCLIKYGVGCIGSATSLQFETNPACRYLRRLQRKSTSTTPIRINLLVCNYE
jgi:hypothetical protein